MMNLVIENGVVLGCDDEYAWKSICFARDNPELVSKAEKVKEWIDSFEEYDDIPTEVGFEFDGIHIKNPFYFYYITNSNKRQRKNDKKLKNFFARKPCIISFSGIIGLNHAAKEWKYPLQHREAFLQLPKAYPCPYLQAWMLPQQDEL